MPMASFVTVGEGAVAVVDEEAVGAEIAGDVEVVVAVVVGVGVPEVERPAGEGETGLLGAVREGAVAWLLWNSDRPPPLLAVSKLSGKKRGVSGWKMLTGWK